MAKKVAKKKTAKKANAAFMKPKVISDDLKAVVGKGPMPTTQVMKKLWAYIKSHKLQDPKNKRMIKPDANLAKVLGKGEINMMKMTSKVFKHLS
ncbi:MAG TPA: SWIB/MDM2 domain-containing protein [Nitrososphaera sp.]|nr:SWIB/MDM2 domain-containing protein [Nitrososphaera sp.]